MTQRSLFWPISFVLCFGFMLWFAWSGLQPEGQGLTFAQQSGCTPTTPSTAYNACRAETSNAITMQAQTTTADSFLTATAAELTEVAQLNPCRKNQTGYPTCVTQTAIQALTNTAQPTNTNTSVVAPQPQQTNTSTPTPTNTVTRTATTTATVRVATPTTNSTPTATIAQTTEPSDGTVPTPTPTIEGELCIPGEVFTLTGEAPPDTPLIVTFDPLAGEGTPTPTSSRTVAGGRSDSNGRYRIALLMGDEKAGTYEVQVRVRSTREVVNVSLCTVLVATPTATLGN
jgi:hypothetical protein